MGMTMTQKILAAHAGLPSVSAGQLIEADLDLVLGNDITSPVAIHEIGKMNVEGVFHKDKIALVMDHFAPNKDIKSAEHCKCVREFACKNDITNYFDVGEMGIEHALLPEKGLTVAGDVIIGAGLKISLVYLVVGIADFIYQKYRFNEEMKMTKQEVKDEYKNTEGNPEVKGRQRQRMREASRRRMMQDVPKADVVITNPTHLAVAIKYEPEVHKAPVVLAKGEDYLAQKIREAARENHIEIVENKPLARLLYANVEIGSQDAGDAANPVRLIGSTVPGGTSAPPPAASSPVRALRWMETRPGWTAVRLPAWTWTPVTGSQRKGRRPDTTASSWTLSAKPAPRGTPTCQSMLM